MMTPASGVKKQRRDEHLEGKPYQIGMEDETGFRQRLNSMVVDPWLTHKSFKPSILLRINVLIAKDSQKMWQRNSFCDKTFPLGAKTSDPVRKPAAEATCTVR